MNPCDFRQQLISIEFRQTVVLVDPVHKFGESDAHRIIQRAISANGHDGVVILELGPGDGAAFDHAQLHGRLQWNLDGGAGDFSVAHGGVAVADVEQSSLYIHRKIHGVAHAGFRRVHVAAEFRGDYRTARLTIGRRDPDAAEERMHGNLDGEIRIERLECGRVRGVIDGIEPDALGKRRMQHGGVVGLVDGAKSGSERAHARVAIDLQIENLYGERVPGLRTLDEKWPAQPSCAFEHDERDPGPNAPTPVSPSTCRSRILTASVSPGCAPSTKNGPLSGLSPLTMLSVSPGFLSAFPKQSSVLVSRMSPDFRCATGSAVANRYFTSSTVVV